MDNNHIQSLINDYNILLSNIEQNNIKNLEYGFINNDCTPTLFSILIHCVQNINIFNNNQLNNISNFINKLSYGG